MISKLPKISKDLIITSLIIFAAFIFRSVFALTQTSHFTATHIPYLLIAYIPFTVFIASKLSQNFKKNLSAPDIMALVVIMYALVVVLHDTVLRYSVMTAIGITSVSLLLCTNVYLFPIVAVLNLSIAFVPQLGCAAVVSIPATVCLSMVSFSYIFEKKQTISKKTFKKSENSAPTPDYKKEKIIFAICETIMVAALVIMAYKRRYSIHTDNFISNIKYIAPILIPTICFVIFAVLTIKNKKSFIGVVGYIVAIAAMPFSQLSADYSIAATGTLTAFMLILALCDTQLLSGKCINEVYGKVIAKTSKDEKVAEV